MYFLIAGSDEPPRSFKLFMALLTIFDVGGWDGLTRGFFGAAEVFLAFLDAGDAPAAAGAADSAVATVSLIVLINFFYKNNKIA